MRSVLVALALLFASSAQAQPSTATPFFGRYTEAGAAALTSASPEARVRAARELGRFGESRRAITALSNAVTTEGHSAVRRALVDALARRGGAAVVTPLRNALRLGSDEDRIIVARALGAIGSEAALRALATQLADENTAIAARVGLARAGARSLPWLVRAIAQDESRLAAVEALGAIADSRGVPSLVVALGDSRDAVKVAALSALATIGDERGAPAIGRMLADPSVEVRVAALTACARACTSEQSAAVAPFLEAETAEERRAALPALARTDFAAALRAIVAALAASDPERARTAIDVALAATRPEIVPVLHGLAREGTFDDEASSALAEVEGAQGVSALLELARTGPRPEGAAQSAQPTQIAAERALAIALRRHEATIDGDTRRDALALLQRPRSGRDVELALVLRAVARDRSVGAHAARGLASEDSMRRSSGAHALELLGDRAYADEIAKAIDDERDAEAFRRLATAGAKLGSLAPLRVLRPWLGDPETAPEAMMLAASELESLERADRTELRMLFRASLRHADPRVRCGAALALGRARDRASWRALIDRMLDGVTEVRFAAARALEAIAAPQATAQIVAEARVEADPRVRAAIEAAAGASERGVSLPGEPTGDGVLRTRVMLETANGVQVDVVLPDGRWLRMRTLPHGDVLLTDLAYGTADVRVRVAE